MALPIRSHNFINLPSEPVFVPKSCYVSTLKLALELALELREKCEHDYHRSQVEEIDEALVEIGEGRDPLQAIADRARLKEIKTRFLCYSYAMAHDFPFVRCCRYWEKQNVKVSRREFDAVQLGQSVRTRGVLAVATMKTHEYTGRYLVRLEFKEPVDA